MWLSWGWHRFPEAEEGGSLITFGTEGPLLPPVPQGQPGDHRELYGVGGSSGFHTPELTLGACSPPLVVLSEGGPFRCPPSPHG